MLYRIAAEEMQVSSKLLETAGLAIHKKIWKTFPDAVHVRVCLKKLNPPVGAPCQASVVVLESSEAF